ncbi:MAG: TrpB-like pyridoxal phosphate-dependent enzyme [Candidatus Nealsonbacteria bacterium]|nr:TrpB-like pyridoxal phosphate-dependent enzyme [Candidatus Nealsonbacteria bacterium]
MENIQSWYNIVPDLAKYLEPLPPPKGGEEVLKVLVPECLKQEMSREPEIEIPKELQQIYAMIGRPRPLVEAKKLQAALKTPARLFYKTEFYSPTGSHKLNTALAQAFYAKQAGIKRLVTETGAGQWGTAVAYAAKIFGLEAAVYWVRAAHDRKPERRKFMEELGAVVYASPSTNTGCGQTLLHDNPNHQGSLGIAISEGLEDAISRKDTAYLPSSESTVYVLGSVLNHVLLHQTIIGLEARQQFEELRLWPDIVISCLGGGSNFGGIALPFMKEVLAGGKKIRFIASQTQAAPSLIKGKYRYDYADHAGLTPKLKMYTLGHKAKLAPSLAEGLRYASAAPIISLLRNHGLIEAVSPDESFVFCCAKLFYDTEGPLPPPVVLPQVANIGEYNPRRHGFPAVESIYSIATAIEEALECKATGEKKIILFNISGHGFLDEGVYQEAFTKYRIGY